jgi:hypothetical protein
MKDGLRAFLRATTPWDRLLLVLVWGGVAGGMASAVGGPSGREAEIVVGGEVVKRVALSREQELTVEGPLGTSHLQVKEGAIRFIPPSPAPRKIDLRAGWQSRAGDTAACVPNEVMVRVTGDPQGSWDAVNY